MTMSVERVSCRIRAAASAALLAAAATLAWGHSDPRMFGQITQSSTTALATPRTVKLPPGVSESGGLFSLEPARAAVLASRIKTYGQVVPNASAVLDVNALVSGQVAEVRVRPGDSVRKGEALVTVFNPEFITTQKGYLEFLKNEEKLEVLREEGRLPNYLKDAKENLRWWGMTDQEIAALIEQGRVVEHIVLHAPSDGFVTDMFVKPGSLVNAGDRTMKQFVVVGKAVARMVATDASYWVEGYVYPDQRSLLRPGMPVSIGLPGGRVLERKITQVMPTVDAQTQRARFMVDLGRNPAGLAVGQMVEIGLHQDGANGTWIPRQAVLGQAIDPVVYVRTGPGVFMRKPVAVLAESDAWLQVKGIAAGDRVVVAGKMMLEGLYRISAGAGAGAGGNAGDHHH